MIGVDLFSGAGGMSLGAEAAGIAIHSAVEADRHAAKTYALNKPHVKVLARDVRTVQPWELYSGTEDPFVVFGGPPCQGFSTSNQRTRSVENASNWLFSEYLRIVRELRPRWVVFENVKGIIETEGGLFLRAVVDQLSELEYRTTTWLLNAADYGVPQKRWRVFVIGSRDGVVVAKPTLSGHKPPTLHDAIADLPILRNGASNDIRPYRTSPQSEYARCMRGQSGECGNHLVTHNSSRIVQRYASISPGGNWKSIPEDLMKNYADRSRCHTGIYYRLKYDEPSIVIGNFRKNMLVHPTQGRGLSIREAARIQSFPDSFRFCGSIGFQQQQVGNAVPPLLAQAVFKAIIEHS